MKKLLHSLLFGLATTFVLFLASPAFAGTIPEISPVNSGKVDAPKTVQNIAVSAINILLFVTGAIAIIYVILGGYRYITAGGDPKKAEAARSTIINAVIGVIIVTASYFIINVAISAGTTLSSTSGNPIKF